MIKKVLSKLRISRLYWHDLKSVHPVSTVFGFDRGTPIDRYYIENFLKEKSQLIRGRVLEVAESHYSKKFGSEVTDYEVLHIEPSKNATIIGDLTKLETLPNGVIDCFICTQVFNFIFDFQKAIQGSHQLLKPGGTLLATVSGISQISRYDADRWGHYWSFYPQGIERSIKNVFGEDNVDIKVYGNSLSAISFLKGIAMQELTSEELDFADPDYPICISIVAKKTNG
jgi:SAM-dependent methyltransferase